MARLGKVSLGSGDQITLDFVGDGLMKVTVPSNQLGLIRDTKGRPLSSLIRNTGIIKANGGLIELSAHTAQSLSRGSVNIGATSDTGRISLTLPFNSNNSAYYAGEGYIGYTSYTGATPRPVVENGGTRLYFYNENSTNLMTWQNFSGKRIDFSATYQRT